MLSGFASSGFADGTLSDLTRNQKVGPTLHYSSPEAISTPGSRRYLLERDVWAWGCTCLVVSDATALRHWFTYHVRERIDPNGSTAVRRANLPCEACQRYLEGRESSAFGHFGSARARQGLALEMLGTRASRPLYNGCHRRSG